ncbi:MAG: hypothetical protein U0871_25020 [Gemmataceae bacterium]
MFSGMLAGRSDPELKDWLGTKAGSRHLGIAIPLMNDLFALAQKKSLTEAGGRCGASTRPAGVLFCSQTAAETNKMYADHDAALIADVGHRPVLEKTSEFSQKLRAALKEFAKK